ncbi:MAG: indole-3-glycerol-phosphate synthase [candidate division WOR-3 bacterium]
MFLKEVLKKKKLCVEKKKVTMPLKELESGIQWSNRRSFFQRFSKRYSNEIKIIAEFKNASPSSGFLGDKVDFAEQILKYERGGAEAISVVTEQTYFGGDNSYVKSAKEISFLPVLRKDFIVDLYEIVESKHLGADAVLLVAEILTPEKIKEFIKACSEYDIDVLLEAHTEEALSQILRVFDGTFVVGINSRDLSSLRVDHYRAERMVRQVPQNVPVILESGIRDKNDIDRFKQYGVSGFLVGTILMRAKDPEGTLKRLKYGAS